MKTNVSRLQPRRVRAASRIPVSPWQEDSQNILIRADGVELTDQLRAAVSRKIGRARRYAPRAMRARVQLHKVCGNPSPAQFRVRVHYELPGNDLVAEHTAHDPLAALDIVADKMERQLRRRKTARLVRRVRSQRRKAHTGLPGCRG